jgi:hypothetical protein
MPYTSREERSREIEQAGSLCGVSQLFSPSSCPLRMGGALSLRRGILEQVGAWDDS